MFLLKFPGWLSLVVEIEYSEDGEQGLSFLKSFDDQVGKFDLCGGGFLLQFGITSFPESRQRK